MNKLTKFLVDGILNEEKQEIVALYAGGFKPPTSGHFQVVEEALDNYPEIDKLIVFVGTGTRDGIEQAESILTWEIYQNYLPMKVEIAPAKKPAIAEVYSYASANPEKTIYWILGARDGDEGDLADIASRTKSIDKAEDKYNNVEVKVITTLNAGVSGTNARKALIANDKEAFFKFIPTQVKEKEEIFTILKPAQTEQLTEHSMGDSIDLEAQIGRLTQHMLDKGYNIEPLPSLELIDDDHSNAGDFLGKTAYYNPDTQAIVLYTHARHPKDIARSYAHEMIHHIQNLEGRLGDITTTNTQEDDRLNDIEAEANLKGTMTFRNWTDSLNEGGEDTSWSDDDDTITLQDILELTKNIKTLDYPTEKLAKIVLNWDDNPEEIERISQVEISSQYPILIMVDEQGEIQWILDGNHRAQKALRAKSDTIPAKLIKPSNLNSKAKKILLDLVSENIDKKTEDQLKQYIEDYSEIDVDLLKTLIKLKSKYPTQLDPTVGGNEYAYRGTTFDKDFISKLKVKNDSNGVIEYEVPPSLKITSKGDKGFLSFTTDEKVAQGFGQYSGYVDHKSSPDRVGGYVKVTLDNPNFILHPDYTGELSKDMEYSKESEKETLYVGNSYTPESIYVVKKDIPLGENINEEIDLSKHVEDWLNKGGGHDNNNINRTFTIKLKQLGYESFGTIYRVLFVKNAHKIDDLRNHIWDGHNGKNISFSKTKEGAFNFMDQLISHGEMEKGETFVVIKQKSNYYDLSKWVKDEIYKYEFGRSPGVFHWENDASMLYNETQKTQEVLAVLASDFQVEGRYARNGKKLSEKENKDPFGLNAYARELAMGLEEAILNEGRYDKLTNQVSSIAFEAYKDIHDRGDSDGSFQFKVGDPEKNEDVDIASTDFEFDFLGTVKYTDDEYLVDGGANAGFDKFGDEIQPMLSVTFKIPRNPDWQRVSFDLKDVVRHELEHLTQDGENLKPGKYIEDDAILRKSIEDEVMRDSIYYMLPKEVDAMLQGLYLKAKKSKRPFAEVIDEYLNIFLDKGTITQEEKETILKVWRRRNKALSLPVFENEKEVMDYTIYLDMDGVLVDFDKQFEELTGMAPSAFEAKNTSDEFWAAIDSAGVGFWRGMKWMPGGEALYNRASKFPHFLLSSPSRSDVSKIGKHLWRRDKTPSTKLILARSYNKKNYANPSSVLIDDREDNIKQWRDAGGIGILYTSAEQVNRELDKLGL